MPGGRVGPVGGEQDRDARPLARRALDAELPAPEDGHPLGDAETEAEAAGLPARAGDLHVAADRGELLEREARPVVRDDELDAVPVRPVVTRTGVPAGEYFIALSISSAAILAT